MNVLITGAAGFVGRHLAREMSSAGYAVLPTDHPAALKEAPSDARPLDVCAAADVESLVRETRPEYCVHLAGIAFVPMGWQDPERVFQVNTQGTLHLLEALRRHSPRTRLLVVSSVEIYGRKPRARPITEDTPMLSENLYAVSKLAADLSALLYARHYGMPVMTARPQNHIGPGQSLNFAVPAFARQLIAIRRGVQPPRLRVGNLDSEREFTDVRDVVRAYRLLLEKGVPGEAYNVASGHFMPMRTVLETLCRLANVQPDIEIDPALYRPTDTFARLDTRKIRRDAGWEPQLPLEQTLKDILDDCEAHFV